MKVILRTSLILTALFACLLVSTFAHADEALATSKACMACHRIDSKVLGPPYRDVANKYADDPDAVALLAEKISNGSSGVWGAVPMPANRTVSAEEARTLAEWILSLKGDTDR